MGQNDLGGYGQISLEGCADKCNQEPSCLSFEYSKPAHTSSTQCQLSSSCNYASSAKDTANIYCFYEKQGTEKFDN